MFDYRDYIDWNFYVKRMGGVHLFCYIYKLAYDSNNNVIINDSQWGAFYCNYRNYVDHDNPNCGVQYNITNRFLNVLYGIFILLI